jgi:hypothetical protein
MNFSTGGLIMSKRPISVALAALLFLLTLTVGMALAQVPTATPTPSPLPPPSASPGPTTFFVTTLVPSTTPGCAAPLPLSVDALAYVRGGVYVRNEPNGSSPWVNYYEQSVVVRITGGPVCDGVRYNWWQVRGPGNDGWVAEGSPTNYLMSFAAPPGGGTPCNPPAALTIGERTRLLNDLNVHEIASQSGLVLTVASTGSLADVLEGPVCADGVNYWRVRVTVVNVSYTGWVADASADGTPWLQDEFFLATPVCVPPLPLSIGGRGYVNYRGNSPKSLRSAPSINAGLIASLLDGIGFEIIGGPVCAADGMNWWQVRILSRPDVTGWIAEGGPGNYWISPGDDSLHPIPPAPPYQP